MILMFKLNVFDLIKPFRSVVNRNIFPKSSKLTVKCMLNTCETTDVFVPC